VGLRLREEGGHILRDFYETDPSGASFAIDVGGQWALLRPVREEVEDHRSFHARLRIRSRSDGIRSVAACLLFSIPN
jgi:hypothetical protein